jgi:hypothetical protein
MINVGHTLIHDESHGACLHFKRKNHSESPQVMLCGVGTLRGNNQMRLGHVCYLNINIIGNKIMTTYKFSITKRPIMESSDSSMHVPTAETFANATDEANSNEDIDVSIYLDDVLKHSVTLTDAGATLQFDADIAAGDHTIKIVAPKDPIQQTDICVDQFFVDDSLAWATQWDFDNQILDTASTLRQKLSPHNAQPHQYVWWGRMVNNDSSLNLDNMFYRPGIVSDHQGEWHMEFTKTTDGHIWITKQGNVDDLLWDSTAQHTYYFCQASASDQDTIDSAYLSYQNTVDTGEVGVFMTDGQGTISSSVDSTTVTGAGTQFLSEVNVGDRIMEGDAWDQDASLYRCIGVVASITNDTTLVLTENASVDKSGTEYGIMTPAQWSYFSITVDDGGTNVTCATARTQGQIDGNNWQGPGTYQLNSNKLEFVNDNIDESIEDADHIVIFSWAEYRGLVKMHWYHRNYTVTPITVT